MDNKQFKKTFDTIAQKFHFEKAFGGWFKTSEECIVVLDLQKSNFGNYYKLNINIFIQGMFGKHYIKQKELVKRDIGDVRSGVPKEFRDAFDLENSMDDSIRKQKLENLFIEYIVSFTNQTLTREGIKALAQNDNLFLLPAVKKELGL